MYLIRAGLSTMTILILSQNMAAADCVLPDFAGSWTVAGQSTLCKITLGNGGQGTGVCFETWRSNIAATASLTVDEDCKAALTIVFAGKTMSLRGRGERVPAPARPNFITGQIKIDARRDFASGTAYRE